MPRQSSTHKAGRGFSTAGIFLVMAEADGNRTRQTGIARLDCVEDSEAHQVLIRLRVRGYSVRT